jgi:uncharacterized protein (DUF1697 family)
MSTRIAFLRAVNLGKRRVAMPRLVAVCEGLGYTDVWTWINSGNAVFDATGSRAAVEKAMEEALEAEFGFECTTFVRTPAQLRKSLDATPFPLSEGDTHFVTFLKTAPTAAQKKALEDLSGDFDTLVVDGPDVHWRMRGRSTESRLKSKDWERVLGPLSSTSRNVTMLRKLVAKTGGAE